MKAIHPSHEGMLTCIRENKWQRRGQCLQLQWKSWVSKTSCWDTQAHMYKYRANGGNEISAVWVWKQQHGKQTTPTSAIVTRLLPCRSDHLPFCRTSHFCILFPSMSIKFSFPVLGYKTLCRAVPAYHLLSLNWLSDCPSSLSTPLTSMKLKYQENTFLTRLINDSILSLCRSLPLPHFIHPSEQNETIEEINFPAATMRLNQSLQSIS